MVITVWYYINRLKRLETEYCRVIETLNSLFYLFVEQGTKYHFIEITSNYLLQDYVQNDLV